MKRTLLAIAISAICAVMPVGVLANNADSNNNEATQQEGTTAGQQRSIDDSANQGQQSGNNDSQDQSSSGGNGTGTQGPQEDSEGDALDIQDQEDVDNSDIREEQSGSSMATQDQ